MYKWHVHSAIGRGRPLPGDLTKVADGIAASLRQFHLSAMRSAGGGGDSKPTRPSRTERSAAAAAEISSLSPGGIDARLLAARPPPSFTIRRVEQEVPAAVRGPAGASRGASRGAFQFRGLGLRGSARGARGRGGVRGGANRGRASIRRRAGGKKFMNHHQKAPPLTPEEQAYVDSIEMGLPSPARVGITELESLRREAPGMAALSTPIGIASSIREHYRALAGEKGNEYISTEQHARHYYENGATLFVDEEDKARATGPERFPGSPETYEALDEADQESILQTMAAGRYQSIKPVFGRDLLANVEAYGLKNGTYLPKDAVAVRERVQSMLSGGATTKPAAQAARQQ